MAEVGIARGEAERPGALRNVGSVRRTAQQAAFEQIRAAIVSGAFAPGTRLRLDELAEQLGMSHMPVREALRRCEAEGLVDFAPYQGASVAALRSDDIVEIWALRAAVEGYAAKLAAPRLTEEDLEALAGLVDAMEGARADVYRWLALNEGFLLRLCEAAGPRRLAGTTRQVLDETRRYRLAFIQMPGQTERILVAHRSLLEALRRRDGLAAERVIQETREESAKVFALRVAPSDGGGAVRACPGE